MALFEPRMLTSIISRTDLVYPDGAESFSPSERFPEYPFRDVATRPNQVYRAVRDCLLQLGLDAKNAGRPEWNPLGEFIEPGSKVFILCNFVYHRRPNESKLDFLGKCTHGSVVRAIIDYVYIATGSTGTIQFGNAPLQSCSWKQVLSDTESDAVLSFYRTNGVAVDARDLRLLIAERTLLGRIPDSIERSADDGVYVTLGESSALNALYDVADTAHTHAATFPVAFRVSDYNPERTESCHHRNRHQYVINREVLTSDVVISVPKLKTHEKVGITVGLKGMVGAVGHKDCLAHHRFGPPTMRGDEYPDAGQFRVLLSRFHDFVYRRSYPKWLRPVLEIVDENIRRIMRRVFRRIQAGAWHGNDTAWRMAIDLSRIMHFADRRGRMTNEPQRRHLVFIDAVVGGEGEGPLSPKAVSTRAVAFSDHLVCGDVVACRIMGYEPDTVALVREALGDHQLRAVPSYTPSRSMFNGRTVGIEDIPALAGRPFAPPAGWRGILA
jgi:uncharacterized protein (DUF362 family)